jgi:hypothetical protein
MIVEVVDRGLLASSACVRPYNDAEFPSCRASRPSCNAGRDQRVATSTDRGPTKSNVFATDAHSDGPLPLGLSVTTVPAKNPVGIQMIEATALERNRFNHLLRE